MCGYFSIRLLEFNSVMCGYFSIRLLEFMLIATKSFYCLQ